MKILNALRIMKVILFPDYKEEDWTSMDVYTDNLLQSVQSRYASKLSITSHVTLPGLSKFFSSKHKQTRQFFRYIINTLGTAPVKADVYHITDQANAHFLAVLNPKKTIITCHDLTAPYWMMGYVKPTIKKRVKHAVERWRVHFLKNAAKIIAVSEATKQDIIRHLQIPDHKIVVIPEGVSSLFVPCLDKNRIERIQRTYAIPKNYVLHVGTNFYNKNIEGLLTVFFRLAEQDASLYLVKVGKPWTNEQQATIASSKFAGRIHHIGSIKTIDLPAIYSGAKALIQVSHAEGFGFTVLEAMACGCPVIINKIPALQEMVRSNGIQISIPLSEKDLAKIQHLLKNKKEQKIYKLRGIKRSRKYSWNICAKRTFQEYAKIATSIHIL